jgi:hypothetical protein
MSFKSFKRAYGIQYWPIRKIVAWAALIKPMIFSGKS